MKRACKVSLGFATANKQRRIMTLLQSYRSAVNSYIKILWNSKQIRNAGTLALLKGSRLSERYKQAALKQAWVKAEDQRALQVKAKTAADQQEKIQISLAGIEAEKNNAEAAKNKAQGMAAESLVYEAKVKAIGGAENFIKLEVAKMVVDKLGAALIEWKPVLPTTVVMGGGGSGSSLDSITAGVMAQFVGAMEKAKPVVVAAPATK